MMRRLLRRARSALSFAALAVPVWALSSIAFVGAAEAGSQNIGEVASGVKEQFGSLADLLGAAAFLAGVGFVVFGIVKFYNHSKNPQDQQNKLSGAVMLIVAGAMMIAVPTVAGVGVVSLFGGDADKVSITGGLKAIK